MHYLRNAFAAVVLLAPAFLTGVLGANSPGCGKTPTMKDGTYTAQVNGKARQYILKLPANYDNSHPYRLVFTLHALGGNAQQLTTGSGAYYALPPLANNSAIFVSPNGLNSGWGNTGGEDILFIDAMLLAIEADLCVDQNLRFSCGFSYGGAMSYAISCARAEKFRAIGIFSGGTMSGCQGGKPSGPIATYQQHGTNDQVLNIDQMGRGVRNAIIKANGCTPVTPEPMPNGAKATRTDYKGCKEGYPVSWVVFTGPHTPGYVDQGATQAMAGPNFWAFLSQFK